MKSNLILFLLVLTFVFSGFEVEAQKHKNKSREKKKFQEVEAVIHDIPIYRGKIDGDYEILGPVNGQDIFAKSIKGIAWQIKVQAYKLGADAVVEFECKTRAKNTFQDCQGFAIKFKKGPY